MNDEAKETNLLSQDEVNDLLTISGFIHQKNEGKSLIEEIRGAILDSGKLELTEWRELRARLKEIEQLIPHIDLIISLKAKQAIRG